MTTYCQMCGEFASGNKFCSLRCSKSWHDVKHKQLYTNILDTLITRGNDGMYFIDYRMDILQSFNWLTRIAPDTYKLSAHGYRAIEMMYGDSIGEAS